MLFDSLVHNDALLEEEMKYVVICDYFLLQQLIVTPLQLFFRKEHFCIDVGNEYLVLL